MTAHLTALARDELGATAIEYAFLIALIALAIFGSAELLGTSLSGFYSTLGETMKGLTS